VAEVLELDPEELARGRQHGVPHILLDVRREDELEQARIEGALHIPERELETRTQEIPRDHPIVVMCHRGDRSWRAARLLVTDGFTEVYNLAGGIDEYTVRVDSSLRRYQ
jgi:sulfur-carrier protein adenylyltransferase/sulfurtransferase